MLIYVAGRPAKVGVTDSQYIGICVSWPPAPYGPAG
jgi:hypothetical protein